MRKGQKPIFSLHIGMECCDLCDNKFHRPNKIINNKLDRKKHGFVVGCLITRNDYVSLSS